MISDPASAWLYLSGSPGDKGRAGLVGLQECQCVGGGLGVGGSSKAFSGGPPGLVSERTWMVCSPCWSGLLSELSKGLFTGNFSSDPLSHSWVRK